MSLKLYKEFEEIIMNKELKNEIENLDELLLFYKDVMNSILYMKNKINLNNKYKENYKTKINDYISIDNLNNNKNKIISDSYEAFIENLKSYKDNINELKVDRFIKQLNDNRYNNCLCLNNISNYLLYQKKYIIKFLDILIDSKTFIELFENEIIKKAKEIINDNNEEEGDENDND